MYSKVEFSFNVSDIIDPTNEYHLWIPSIAMALNDLLTVNKYILRYGDDKDRKKDERLFFYAKLNVGFLHEAYELINKFNARFKEKLHKIDNYSERLKEIRRIYNKDNKAFTVTDSLIRKSRNKIFHYTEDKKYFKALPELLIEFKKENFKSACILSKNLLNKDCAFGEEIQLNLFCDFYKLSIEDNETENIIHNLAEISAIFIDLLEIILYDFISNIDKKLYTTLRYK